MTAKKRYDVLSSNRSQFLQVAEDSSKLTLPYLIHQDDSATRARNASLCRLSRIHLEAP